MKYRIGADEVGRGCLAGPVCVAAVCAKQDATPVSGWGDSKKLSEKKRESVAQLAKQQTRVAVSYMSPAAIDELGINGALLQAYKEAIQKVWPEDGEVVEIIIDGDFQPLAFDNLKFLPKGDSIEWLVGAASCVAKQDRDAYMVELGKQYPHYKWESNKGYGSKDHLLGIAEHGLGEHHRKTFCRRLASANTTGASVYDLDL